MKATSLPPTGRLTKTNNPSQSSLASMLQQQYHRKQLQIQKEKEKQERIQKNKLLIEARKKHKEYRQQRRIKNLELRKQHAQRLNDKYHNNNNNNNNDDDIKMTQEELDSLEEPALTPGMMYNVYYGKIINNNIVRIKVNLDFIEKFENGMNQYAAYAYDGKDKFPVAFATHFNELFKNGNIKDYDIIEILEWDYITVGLRSYPQIQALSHLYSVGKEVITVSSHIPLPGETQERFDERYKAFMGQLNAQDKEFINIRNYNEMYYKPPGANTGTQAKTQVQLKLPYIGNVPGAVASATHSVLPHMQNYAAARGSQTYNCANSRNNPIGAKTPQNYNSRGNNNNNQSITNNVHANNMHAQTGMNVQTTTSSNAHSNNNANNNNKANNNDIVNQFNTQYNSKFGYNNNLTGETTFGVHGNNPQQLTTANAHQVLQQQLNHMQIPAYTQQGPTANRQTQLNRANLAGQQPQLTGNLDWYNDNVSNCNNNNNKENNNNNSKTRNKYGDGVYYGPPNKNEYNNEYSLTQQQPQLNYGILPNTGTPVANGNVNQAQQQYLIEAQAANNNNQPIPPYYPPNQPQFDANAIAAQQQQPQVAQAS